MLNPSPPDLRSRDERRGAATDRLVTAAELADYLGVCQATIYNQLKAGLPSVKIGRARRFRLDQVDAYLDAQRTGGVA